MRMAPFDGGGMAPVVVEANTAHAKSPVPDATTIEPPALKQGEKQAHDSGYGSQKSSPSEQHESHDWKLPSSPAAYPFLLASGRKSHLYVFEREMDHRTIERWGDIETQIEGLLRDYLKTRKKYRFRSRRSQSIPVALIRRMLLGEREADAKEHIVVFCPEKVARSVRKFFDKEKIVKELCEPPDKAYPRILVAVCLQQLKAISQRDIEVFGTTIGNPEHTLCGQPIYFIDEDDHVNQATIGGTVKVVDSNGVVQLYALTAGHCLLDWAAKDEISDDSVDEDSDCEGSSFEEVLEDDEAFVKKANAGASVRKDTNFLGQVYQVSSDGPGGYYDWALLKINRNLPNLLVDVDQRGNMLKKSISAEADVELPTGACALEATLTSRKVTMIEHSRKARHGSLSPMVGRIMIGPGDTFTDTYILSLDDGFDAVSDGSSGTWVVDSSTLKVLGHVVAIDMCGDAYIIPMGDILGDIQRQLGAVDVSLASIADVSTIATNKNELSIATNDLPKRTYVNPPHMSKVIEDEPPMRSSAHDLTTTAMDPRARRVGPPSVADSKRGEANTDHFPNQWLGSLSSHYSRTLRLPSHAATTEETLTEHNQSQTPSSGHSSTAQPSNSSTLESTWGSGSSQRQSKRKLHESDSDYGDEHTNAEKKLRTSTARSTVDLKVSLACPFAIRFPSTCGKCSEYSLNQIQDVERHLAQHHRGYVERSKCLRCTRSLVEEGAQDTSMGCERCAMRKASFMSPHEEARVLGVRNQWEDKEISPEEKWFALYETLFPQASKPLSPWRLVDSEELNESALRQSWTEPESVKFPSSNSSYGPMEGSQNSRQRKTQDASEEELSPDLKLANGILEIGAGTLQSSMALHAIIRGFQSQNKDARALKTEVSDLNDVLVSLLETVSSNPTLDLKPLMLPLQRCCNACEEYARVISQCTEYSDESRSSMRDWITQKYLQGDINDFRAMLAIYKSTIKIALLNANPSFSLIQPNLLENYKDMISDTTYDLNTHLEDLREKIISLQRGGAASTRDLVMEWNAMVEEEKSTQQGLQMCSRLSAQIEQFESASTEQTQFSNRPSAHKHVQSGFEKTRGSIQALMARLKAHEASINSQSKAVSPDDGCSDTVVTQLGQLQQTKESITQCIQILSDANEFADKRVNVFEDNAMADDSYSYLVSTVNDLVTVRGLNLQGRSRFVGGQVTDETIQESLKSLTQLDAEYIRSQSTKGDSSQGRGDLNKSSVEKRSVQETGNEKS